jgi:hypothetical protein
VTGLRYTAAAGRKLLPTNNRVTWLGDSLMITVNPAAKGYGTFGGQGFMGGVSDCSLPAAGVGLTPGLITRLAPTGGTNTGKIWNYGEVCTGGYTTQQIHDTLLPIMLALNPRPGICAICAGANDTAAAAPLAAYKLNMIDIVERLLAADILPMVLSVFPNAGANAHANILRFNQFLSRLCEVYDLPFVNSHRRVVDPATDSFLAANTQGDNIHPSYIGALLYAQPIVDRLYTILGDWEPYLIDAYNADQATAYLWWNGAMMIDSNNPAGVPSGGPTNAAISNAAWSSTGGQADAAYSLVAMAAAEGSGNWWRINRTVSNAGGATGWNSVAIPVPDNAKIAFGFRLKCPTRDVQTKISVQLFEVVGGATYANCLLQGGNADAIAPFTYWTEFVTAPGAANLRVNITVQGNAGAGGVADVYLGQLTLLDLTTQALLVGAI